MYRHPYANVIALPSYSTPKSISRANRRADEEEKVPVRRRRSKTCNSQLTSLSTQQKQQLSSSRPTSRFIIHDAGITLTLNGQEDGIHTPKYGTGDTVDGHISIMNPIGILRVEAKMEGFVSLCEQVNCASARSCLVSETLVFWDSPTDRSTGVNQTDSTVPAQVPQKMPFRVSLPTQYMDQDGQWRALPPTFHERLPTVPGFKGDVAYTISVIVTRARDVTCLASFKNLKKIQTIRTPFLYFPRTCPPLPPPFPLMAKKLTSNPVTKFVSVIEPRAPYYEPIKTTFYLPYSQICPMQETIPFFLTLSGSSEMMEPFMNKTPLPSFLPNLSSDSLASFVSLHQRISHARSLSLSSISTASTHSSTSNMRPKEKPSVRVALVRQIAVDTRFTQRELPDWRARTHVYKTSVIGEGILYTTKVRKGSVSWAGEVRIDPRSGVHSAGFSTMYLTVRDMLIISVEQPKSKTPRLQDFRQVIPMKFTTDSFR